MHSESTPRDPGHPSGAAANRWILDGLRARDHGAGMFATLDLSLPREGIVLSSPGAPVDRLLSLDLPPPWRLADHWARGDDVAAVYESADARTLRATAMWRMHHVGRRMRGWQLIVSTQTALLQSDPRLVVVSSLAARPTDEVAWGVSVGDTICWQRTATADATCVFLRREATRTSVLIAAHPADMPSIRASRTEAHVTVSCRLFVPTLEKGVLLRSRVLAAVSTTADGLAEAEETALAFASLPPPLDT